MIFITFAGFYWEFITRFYRGESVADWYDIIAYWVGAVFYYIVSSSQFGSQESYFT